MEENKEISYTIEFLLDQGKVQIINKSYSSRFPAITTNGELLPFISLESHGKALFATVSPMKEISVKFSRLYASFFFYICFRSLLINTSLVSIPYFVSVQ